MGFFKKLLQSTLEESAEALQIKLQSKVEDLHSAIDDKLSLLESSIGNLGNGESRSTRTAKTQTMNENEIDWSAISRSHSSLMNNEEEEYDSDEYDEDDDESPMDVNARLTSSFLQNSGIGLVDLDTTNTTSSNEDDSVTDSSNSYAMFEDYDKNDCTVCLMKVGPNEALIKGLILMAGSLDDDTAQERIDLCRQRHNAVIARHITESTAKALIDGVRAMGGEAMIF